MLLVSPNKLVTGRLAALSPVAAFKTLLAHPSSMSPELRLFLSLFDLTVDSSRGSNNCSGDMLLGCATSVLMQQSACSHHHFKMTNWRSVVCVVAAMFSALDAAAGIDDSSRKAMKRRLNPAVDLAAAAEDRLTSDGYGLAHNSARSELVSAAAVLLFTACASCLILQPALLCLVEMLGRRQVVGVAQVCVPGLLHAPCWVFAPQGQVEGYAAFSEQLLQDYNVHAAAVMGRTPSGAAGPMLPMSSRTTTAAAAGQAGAEVASEMTDEERQRFRQQTGGVQTVLHTGGPLALQTQWMFYAREGFLGGLLYSTASVRALGPPSLSSCLVRVWASKYHLFNGLWAGLGSGHGEPWASQPALRPSGGIPTRCGGCLPCGVFMAGSGLDDLAAPVQQQFEELSVTNPRLYFSNIQQQQQPLSQQSGCPVKQEGGYQQQQLQQPQDVVRLLREIDANALTDKPMDGPVANKVRLMASPCDPCHV
jgi:hypothetical protein